MAESSVVPAAESESGVSGASADPASIQRQPPSTAGVHVPPPGVSNQHGLLQPVERTAVELHARARVQPTELFHSLLTSLTDALWLQQKTNPTENTQETQYTSFELLGSGLYLRYLSKLFCSCQYCSKILSNRVCLHNPVWSELDSSGLLCSQWQHWVN